MIEIIMALPNDSFSTIGGERERKRERGRERDGERES